MKKIRLIILFLAFMLAMQIPSYSVELEGNPNACTKVINTSKDIHEKENAYFYRGLYYFDISDYDKAISDFTNSIKLAGNGTFAQAESFSYRATSYMLKNNFNMAINDATKTLTIGFDRDAYEFVDWYLRAYYTRGISYYQLKNYSKAISDFSSYIKEVGSVIQYYDFPQMELLLANSYYLRVVSLIDSKTLPLNSRDGMIQVFGNLEAAIRIYSKLDGNKKVQTEELLKKLKAAYYNK